MALSSEDFLKEKDSWGNSLLLAAIAANDTKSALKYIATDLAVKDGQTLVNKENMGNTPLLLALKKGNIIVAEALLKHPLVDVNAKDHRGFTALHWACMLRQDKLIEMLLAKGADPTLAVPRWVKSVISEINAMTPVNLYQNNVRFDDLKAYVDAAGAAIYIDKASRNYSDPLLDQVRFFYYRSPYHSIFEEGKDFKPPFVEREDLHIPGSMAYTDLIFHINDICANLNWKSSKTLFKKTSETGHAAIFQYNFEVGITDFCKNRNAIPVNETLLKTMQEFKPGTKKLLDKQEKEEKKPSPKF